MTKAQTDDPASTETPTYPPTLTGTPTETLFSTNTDTPTETLIPWVSPTASGTETPTGTPIPLVTPTASGTETPTETGTLEPTLTSTQAVTEGFEPGHITNQIILRYKSTTQAFSNPRRMDQMQRLADAAGVSLEYRRAMTGGAHVFRLPGRLSTDQIQSIVNKLKKLPEVDYAEPDQIMYPTGDRGKTLPLLEGRPLLFVPNDPLYTYQWHYSEAWGINTEAAWDVTTGSTSVVVAVIDTGITSHAEFTGRTVPGYDFINDTLVANDGDARDSDPSDPGDWITAAENASGYFAGCPISNSSWHGTHTAGTIGASGHNNLGVAGINWNSKILPVRVLGKCGGYLSDIADGMRWAAGLPVTNVPANANPAKVLSISLGGSGACGTTYQNAINEITAAGATVVVAAGNSAADATNFRPANCTGVITVAGTNRDGYRSYYSNYGATVEISAPGGETIYDNNDGVLSTLNTGTQGPVADAYAFYQGTSMAAPHVSGVVSLLLSLNPALTPAQILSILQSTAKAFPAGGSCTTANCGSGIVNAGAAVASLLPTPTFTPTSTGTLPTPTETATPTGSATPSLTLTSSLTRTRTNTPTITPTRTPTSTVTNTPSPWIVVVNTADSGPGSLRQAVADVTNGGLITFDPSLAGQTITLASTISITKGLTIDGSALSSRVEISGNDSVRIFLIENDFQVTLKSLVLKNGRMTDHSGFRDDGGAIFIYGAGIVDIQDVAFRNNSAYNAGAIKAFSDGRVSIVDSEFTSNTAENFGGAIETYHPTLGIRNSTFTDNSAASGGAIYFDGVGDFWVENNSFANNDAGSGGAVFVNPGGVREITLRSNLFSGNTATSTGGAIFITVQPYGTLAIENNTFYANTADTGGGIHSQGTAVLRNNTFSGNAANAASGVGGGSVYLWGTTTTLYNNILANAVAGGECGTAGSNTTTGGNNLVEDGASACLPSVTGDPLLSPLADNGGPTLTMALVEGSPAIDAGDDANCPLTDARGILRPQGSHCDIGAVEYETGAPTVTPSGTVTPTATVTSTPTRTITLTPTLSLTRTITLTPTITLTRTITPTFSITNTKSPWIVVVNTADSGPGSLRQAVVDVTNGGLITFDPSLAGQTITLASTINITKGLTIDGSALSSRVGISGNNTVRIFNVNTGSQVNFTSLVLKDGLMTGTIYTEYGGAMILQSSSQVSLQNIRFSDNNAYRGGALYVRGAVSIQDCEFQSNSAQTDGGAVYSQYGQITIHNCYFDGNSASVVGGAIYMYAVGSLSVEDSSFIGNASGGGGAIWANQQGTLPITLRRNLFYNNTSTGSGGAVGVAMSTINDPITFENNTFYINFAAGRGGAIYTETSIILRNNTFSNNGAEQAGGGGGGSIFFDAASSTTLYNNIIANASVGGECAGFGTYYTEGNNNLVEDGSAVCMPSLTGDPMLGLLEDNGGPTPTIALLDGSPAIDAGDDANCPSTDQRGFARPAGSHCDIGAYEYLAGMIEPTNTSTPTMTGTPTITIFPPTHTPTLTLTLTETLTPTATPTSTFTESSTITPSLTSTRTFTPRPTDTSTATPTATYTASYTLTFTRTWTNTRTPSATRTPSNTRTPTSTRTQTSTPTITMTPTESYTPSVTMTGTLPTNTQTFTPSKTYTWTPTRTRSITMTPTNTRTPSITMTPSNTRTITITPSRTITRTPVTPTNTRTPSPSWTITRTPITPTVTPTSTLTNTKTPTSYATYTPTATSTETETPATTPIPPTIGSCPSIPFPSEIPQSGGRGLFPYGIHVEYFNDDAPLDYILDTPINWETLTSPAVFREDIPAIDFVWDGAAPASGVQGVFWSACYQGYLQVPEDGSYAFFLDNLDDGGMLFVSDMENPLISSWLVQGPHFYQQEITLSEGITPIRLVYAQGPGNESSVALAWSSSSFAKETIGPAAINLATATPTSTVTRTLFATYTPTITRTGTITPTPSITQTIDPSLTISVTPTRTETNTPTVTNTTLPWIIVVNTDDSGPGSLRQAVADVSDGGTITFAPSLAGQTITLASTIAIHKSMTIDGSDLGSRVEISGNGAVLILSIGTSSNVSISSVVLKNGWAFGAYPDYFGGAVHVYPGSSGTFTNVAFRENGAALGGAVFCDGVCVIQDSEFSSNTSGEYGSGGAILSDGMLTVRNSVFTHNNTLRGGAINIGKGNGIIENCLFSENSAGEGGAIAIEVLYTNSNVRISKNLFYKNTAGTGSGGAVFINASNATTTTEIDNNTFYGNQAAITGGAVDASEPVVLRNNTFSTNRADQASGDGGGSLYLHDAGGTTIYNNIFADSEAGGECNSSGSGSISGGSNLVEDGSPACLPSVTGDPLLDSLADNGGATLTMALLPGSPAIDSGDDAHCSITDARGIARPQGLHCDMGAFESATGVPSVTPSYTSTVSPTGTKTPTFTGTSTNTLTKTPSPTETPTPTSTATQTATLTATPETVTVSVLSAGGLPEAGLKVWAMNGTVYTGYMGTTDAQGQVVLALPLGSYRFRVDKPGKQFWSGADNHCTVPGCTAVTVTTQEAVVVTVKDTSGTPEVGLNVLTYSGTTFTGYGGVTDALGRATIWLPAGNYRFRTTKNGTAFWSGTVNHCTVLGCTNADIITTIPVVVSVLSAGSLPEVGLKVYAMNGDAYAGYMGTTDAAGQVSFTLLQGSYRFRVDKPGKQFWSGTDNHCTVPGCTAVTVTTQEAVVVTVKDTGGNPDVGLNVLTYSGTTFTGYGGVTDALGRATIWLPAGNYRFRTTKNGTVFWSGTDNHCTVLGCTNADITTTIPVVVSVLSTGGQPEVGLNVYAMNVSMYTGYMGVTDAAGQVTFTLPQGSYRFRVDKPGKQFWSGADNHCTVPGCTAVTVTTQEAVVVTVKDTDGNPEVGLNVLVYNGTTFTGYGGVTDALGRATIWLPAGSYRFRTTKDGTAYWSGVGNHCTVPGCTSAGIIVENSGLNSVMVMLSDISHQPVAGQYWSRYFARWWHGQPPL